MLPWFHPWCDALQSARFNTLICQCVRCLSCIFSRYYSPTLPAFSPLFSLALLLVIAVLWHQFLSICPGVGLVPFSEWSHHFLLAYECCSVKSKSFSRFLLCSLLQTSSSSPRFSSTPSSSCLIWVLVGQGLAVSKLEVSWLWCWGSLLITVTSTPTGWSEGHSWNSILYVSKGVAGGNENSILFIFTYIAVIMPVSLFPLHSYLSVRESLMETVWFPC